MTTSSIMPFVVNAIPLLKAVSIEVDRPSCVQVVPMFPIVTSTSRIESKCCWSRCLSALLSAVLLIRLFSSSLTKSLTLLRVVASSAATGSVAVPPPPPVVRPVSLL